MVQTAKIKVASEVIGDYGLSGGVSCPYCSTRVYPKKQIDTCPVCGNEYETPIGYSHRSYK